MAKEIRTIVWCDGPRHGDDEQVEASVTRRFIVDNLKERELDLCDVCDKELALPLIELLKSVGQPVARTSSGAVATTAAPTTSPDAPKRTARRREPELRCPIEECDWLGSKAAGEQHAPKMHGGEALTVLEGRYGRRELDGSRTTLPHSCPDCDAAYDSKGGLTGHRVRAHGYVAA